MPLDDWRRLRVDPGSLTLLNGAAQPFAVRAINLRPADLTAQLAPSVRAIAR